MGKRKERMKRVPRLILLVFIYVAFVEGGWNVLSTFTSQSSSCNSNYQTSYQTCNTNNNGVNFCRLAFPDSIIDSSGCSQISCTQVPSPPSEVKLLAYCNQNSFSRYTNTNPSAAVITATSDPRCIDPAQEAAYIWFRFPGTCMPDEVFSPRIPTNYMVVSGCNTTHLVVYTDCDKTCSTCASTMEFSLSDQCDQPDWRVPS